MPQDVFGRTNLPVPPVWLALAGSPEPGSAASLVESALAARVPLDVTSSPALWGGMMRATGAFLTAVGNSDHERATDDRHALDLVQAHLLQTLSALGRDRIDVYFLRVRRAIEEYQIAGALEAMEMARQEGHIRFLGLCCDGPALATLGMWQFHDAFEVLRVPRANGGNAYSTLAPMAASRRVGVLTSVSPDWEVGGEAVREHVRTLAQESSVLVSVRTPEEVAVVLP